jgi:arginine decarboxylase-like protein
MKKSITLTLSDEELMELQRILLDEDRKAALQFLKTHLGKQVKTVISGEGH